MRSSKNSGTESSSSRASPTVDITALLRPRKHTTRWMIRSMSNPPFSQILHRSEQRYRCGNVLRHPRQPHDITHRKWTRCTLHHDQVHGDIALTDFGPGSHHSVSWIRQLCKDQPLPTTRGRLHYRAGQCFLLPSWRMQRPGSCDPFSSSGLIHSAPY